ncbi:autotransporter family protein [Campylobacter devanensis]|uniref:autotransporter family protein n=1 Tax=Campylobacter devanensis TaxID=3161138 RepID=UPI0015D77D48|nr:autotransporter outer membrane beta-barrel domain-containing protein [Campylobacter sp. P0136]
MFIEHPYLHIINNSTVVFNEKLDIMDGDLSWPVIEQDNDFSGGSLLLDNSTLDIKGKATFDHTDALINHGSTAKIDNLVDYGSKIYVVNDSKLEINKNTMLEDTSLIVKNNSNITINGMLTVLDSGTIEFVDGEFAVNDGGIKIAKSNLNVAGEANFLSSDTELDSSNVNFQDKLTLIDSAMLLKNGSSLNVGGVADLTVSALVVQNGSKVLFGDKFTINNKDNEAEKSIIILDNGSAINVKGDFENHGVIYYGASANNAPKITVEGKTTLIDTTEIGIYATSGDISNLNQVVFLESKGAIENKATDENIYAMYFDPNNQDANEDGFVKYDQNIIDATLNLSKDGKKLLVQILMSGDMQNKPINDKIDFIAQSAQALGINLTAQDLDIITSLFTIEDTKGNGVIATEGIKLAAQAAQGNQEAAQIISKTAKAIQKNSQDSINATSNLINTFNLATKNEVGKRISNVTTRSNASQLANFIESLEGQKFADVSSGVLLSMMADEMAAYQNSFYLNALGAKGDFKDGTNPKIYGAILGYDRMIDDLLIGGYFSYTNSKTENIKLDSDVYELGLYSRYFLDNNEFGFNIAGGYGKNDLSYTQNIFGINKILQSNFNSSYIALGLDYGYRFAINDNASIKPYIGADYLYSKTQNYTLKDETGADFQKVQSNTVKNLKAKLGLEMVKNFDEISIYANAKVKRDLINDEGFTRSSFAGSSAGFNIKGNDKKHTNFAIDTGIAYNATKNLSINLNLGADVNSDDKIYSTSFGAAYKF